ncbi:PREDICTED: uncharacterized protein LOC108966701 [Bactrocera latifrons]|uniref:uncharacterized protein LOC108966701 n=1 Tax=Bactrocera latifrons TaxID=174628 RepID=UPI0008DC7E76|nr:PREDICTED: uncharacterized protein LOC108966701 [Bactrocera latifrons]
MPKLAEIVRTLMCCWILVIYSAKTGAKRNYAILLDRVNYTIHQQGFIGVERFICGRNRIGLSTFTLQLKMQQNITNLQIRDNFYILLENNKTTNVITEITNACDMLSGNYDSTIIKQNIIELQQATKPVLLCPLIENTLYSINNFTLRPSLKPSYLPVMDYMEKLELSTNGVHYLDLIFEGRIKRFYK